MKTIHTFGIRFILRTLKNNKESGLVYARITVNTKRIEISLKKTALVNESPAQSDKSQTPSAESNASLDESQSLSRESNASSHGGVLVRNHHGQKNHRYFPRTHVSERRNFYVGKVHEVNQQGQNHSAPG